MTPEQRIQERILSMFKAMAREGEPIFWEKRQAGGFTYRKGLPDIYGSYYGRHFEIEVKAKKGRPGAMQEKWEARFRAIGVAYLRTSDPEKVRAFLAEMKGRHNDKGKGNEKAP